MKRWIFFAFITILFYHCVPENKKVLTEVKIDLNNPEVRRVLDYQNRQELDSILAFMDHNDPTLRYLACNSFSSYQDPLALKALYNKLEDPVLKVRTAAAGAIGQLAKARSVDSLIMAFKAKDTISVDNPFNSAILEAVGKAGNIDRLKQLSTTSTYRNTDTLLLLGQARAIYRFMLRGMVSPEGTSKMVELLTSETIPDQTRLIAAHYMARSNDADLNPFKFQINKAFNEEENVHIKMALALALGKVDDDEIESNLVDQLKLKHDWRLSCNIIRSIGKESYIKVAESLLNKLFDPNRHVALIAADYFVRNGNKDDASFYREYANDSLHFDVKAKMFEATLVNLPYYFNNTRNATSRQIQALIKNNSKPLEIKAYLNALANDPTRHNWVYEELYKSDTPGIKTACIQALGKMLENENFEFYFRNNSNYVRKKILSYLQEAMEEGDEGVLGASADIISSDVAGLKSFVDSTEFLTKALGKLKMPGQIESINAIEKALGYVNNQPNVDLSKPQSSKPIDWAKYREKGDSLQALVRTSKGVFTIKLFTVGAPQSVMNFVELAEGDFYDGKVFHRVIPNFVIQTGSPRADNYGGKDYVIRSELANAYYDDEGYVGMASAGLHTESTQWFVTHSPTPHLDGRYTIFGKVTKGMDIVHQIYEGDIIEEIVISNL